MRHRTELMFGDVVMEMVITRIIIIMVRMILGRHQMEDTMTNTNVGLRDKVL